MEEQASRSTNLGSLFWGVGGGVFRTYHLRDTKEAFGGLLPTPTPMG